MATFKVNGRSVTVDVDDSTPVLWVLRDTLEMTGTKFGCGLAQCGACTVHLDGQATRSCLLPVGAVEGREITTIEAMAADRIGAAVEAAWVEQDVPQCGYCQSGQIMSAVHLLRTNPTPGSPASSPTNSTRTGRRCARSSPRRARRTRTRCSGSR